MNAFIVGSLIWFVPTGLVWAALATLNFWIWRRSKSTGHLVMLGGSAWLAIHCLLATFDFSPFGQAHGDLAVLVGSAIFAFGFYLSVKTLVTDDLGKLRHSVASKLGKPGVTPTIPYAPPSASAPVVATGPTVSSAPAAPSPSPYASPPPPPARPPASEDLNLR